jgi:hypothetical protein
MGGSASKAWHQADRAGTQAVKRTSASAQALSSAGWSSLMAEVLAHDIAVPAVLITSSRRFSAEGREGRMAETVAQAEHTPFMTKTRAAARAETCQQVSSSESDMAIAPANKGGHSARLGAASV